MAHSWHHRGCTSAQKNCSICDVTQPQCCMLLCHPLDNSCARGFITLSRFLHCRYNEDLELEDAVHTAILTLKVRRFPFLLMSGQRGALSNNRQSSGPSHWGPSCTEHVGILMGFGNTHCPYTLATTCPWTRIQVWEHLLVRVHWPNHPWRKSSQKWDQQA